VGLFCGGGLGVDLDEHQVPSHNERNTVEENYWQRFVEAERGEERVEGVGSYCNGAATTEPDLKRVFASARSLQRWGMPTWQGFIAREKAPVNQLAFLALLPSCVRDMIR
jgi:hypothetical protein